MVGIARHLRVVRDHYQRRAALAHAVHHQLERPRAGLYVQIAGGLVGKYYLRIGYQRARYAHALLFAAGHLVGRVVHAVLEPHRLYHAPRALFPHPPRHAPVRQRHRHVVQRVIRREQVVRLKHEPHMLEPERHQFVLAHALYMPAQYHYLAARGMIQPRQHVQQRRFARARPPDYRAELARHYIKADVF